ncbi:unnamed protein product [Moneuplotes crassus]|uniref:Uncharacterized protein n=1 Tax=Euplotes crassus TaxID=5936 RepID=A0AAD1UHE3_EUPCR|nr:unnamed protein product [Moneuplotes crassus]
MIRKSTREWREYCTKLSDIKKKSNKEILCTECWMFLNYEQKTKHAARFPAHRGSVLTPSQFASELQFYPIALVNNKIIEKGRGVKLVILPSFYNSSVEEGHINVIEELCRETHCSSSSNIKMHTTLSSQPLIEQLCCCDQPGSDISVQDSCYLSTDNKKKNLNSNIDSTLADLCQFENKIYKQLWLTLHDDAYCHQSTYPQTQVPMYEVEVMEIGDNTKPLVLECAYSTECNQEHSDPDSNCCSVLQGAKNTPSSIKIADPYFFSYKSKKSNELSTAQQQSQRLPSLNKVASLFEGFNNCYSC